MNLIYLDLTTAISNTDKSFHYGDGFFTTLLVKQGEIQLWPLHQQRIEQTITRLNYPSMDLSVLFSSLKPLIDSTKERQGIKLLFSRSGGRGYSIQTSEVNVYLSSFDYPEHYLDWQKNGITLGICDYHLGLTPSLAGLKHNNRLEQVLIREEIDKKQWQDAVVLDIEDKVVETSCANLFWVKNSVLYTPNLDYNGVLGVQRANIIRLSEKNNIDIDITRSNIEELLSADEVYITNALMGVIPVTQINNHYFSIGNIGKLLMDKVNS